MERYKCIKRDEELPCKIGSSIVCYDFSELHPEYWEKINIQCPYKITSVERESDGAIFTKDEEVIYNSPFGSKRKVILKEFIVDISEKEYLFVYINNEERGYILLDEIEKL